MLGFMHIGVVIEVSCLSCVFLTLLHVCYVCCQYERIMKNKIQHLQVRLKSDLTLSQNFIRAALWDLVFFSFYTLFLTGPNELICYIRSHKVVQYRLIFFSIYFTVFLYNGSDLDSNW